LLSKVVNVMTKKIKDQQPQSTQAASDPVSWSAFLWRLLVLRPLLVCGLAALVGVGYVGLRIIGEEQVTSVFGLGLGKAAARNALPFEILSITIMLRQSDRTIDGRVERHLNVRTIYTIRGLRELPANSDAMTKMYRKSEAREIRQWHGNVEQAISSKGPTIVETVARFGIHPGEVKSVVFGAEVISDLPFPEDKYRAINDLVKLRPDEAWWGYPNNDGMTIPEIMIILESDTNDLKVNTELPAFRVTAEGNIDHREATTGRSEARAGAECLWARWNNVREKEMVALRYTWGRKNS
jgi:hypothetical protein